MSVPEDIEFDEAVELINNNGVADFARGYGACVFEESDTLDHVACGSRLILCVFDKDGRNKTPVSEKDKFQQTSIAVAASVPKGYVGPKTACKEVGPSNKQTLYMDALEGSSASKKFFAELSACIRSPCAPKPWPSPCTAKQGLFKTNVWPKALPRCGAKARCGPPLPGTAMASSSNTKPRAKSLARHPTARRAQTLHRGHP